MKKYLFFITVLLLLGACGTSEGKEDSTSTPQTTVASETTEGVEEVEEVEEELEAPTAREIDDAQPWQTDPNRIKQFQDEGKVVFLVDDAEEVEKRMVDVSNVGADSEGFNDTFTKADMVSVSAENLQLFIEEVSPYIENEEYLNKLNEVKEAMINEDYETVPTLIEEAKILRESE